jgi:catechol 2,3-dioxygenase-like lactoylglutathione lyase family enzyme
MQANDVRVVERNKFLSEKLDGARGHQRNDERGMMNERKTLAFQFIIPRSSFLLYFPCAHWKSVLYFVAMKMHIKRLDHVQLCIPFGEEEKAREFYTQVLGLEEIEKPEALKPSGGLWFKIADIQLHIGVEEGQTKSKRHPAFEVEGLEQIREHLRENRVKIKEEIPVPGLRRLSFFDPFENRIELLEKSNGEPKPASVST